MDTHQNSELTLILGANGKTGRRIAAHLAARNIPTRLAGRSTEPHFEWHDPATWDTVLAGVKRAYICYAPDVAIPGATAIVEAFVNKAVASGVERLVLLSGRGEEEAQRCEEIVQNSGAQWTIVRSSWFSQNFSEGVLVEMVQAGVISLPAGDIPEPFVDVDDIAEVAAAALSEEGHASEIYEVTGPRLMTFKQVTAELAQASGREIQYVQLTPDVYKTALIECGAPSEMVWLLDYLFTTVLDGRNAFVADGVQRALGRPPRDFSDYALNTALTGVWDGSPTAKLATA